MGSRRRPTEARQGLMRQRAHADARSARADQLAEQGIVVARTSIAASKGRVDAHGRYRVRAGRWGGVGARAKPSAGSRQKMARLGSRPAARHDARPAEGTAPRPAARCAVTRTRYEAEHMLGHAVLDMQARFISMNHELVVGAVRNSIVPGLT